MILGTDFVVEDDRVGPIVDDMNVEKEFVFMEGMLVMGVSVLVSVALFVVVSDR